MEIYDSDYFLHFNYEELKIKYNKYNFKELILPKLNLEIDFQLNTLEDFELLMVKFAEHFPYNNIDVLKKNGITNDLDYIVETMIVKEVGNICLNHNILFGMLLQEYGLKVQLVKAIDGGENLVYPNIGLHYTNVMVFNNKKYLIDACFTFLSCYFPIEIGNEIGQSPKLTNNPKIYRIIPSSAIDATATADNVFIYQEKTGALNDFVNVYSFNLNPISLGQFKYSANYFVEFSSVLTGLVFFLKFDEGYYYYTNGVLKISYENGTEEIINVNNNTQLLRTIKKYFKIINIDLKSITKN
ncbi:hypothetical protein ACTA71_011441 [Dictyostelium dimigraforme]